MRIKIMGTGSSVPNRIVRNSDLEQMVETSDEWIRERTGIGSRYVIEEETTVSMAVESAKKALENAKLDAEEVDLIIVSTFTSNLLVPSAACAVQREIGAKHAFCFDVNGACTGFIIAYETARAYIESGFAKKALIIGSESLSKVVDWKDRGSCILFGDGAGAAILGKEEGRAYEPVLHSDGEKADALICENAFLENDGKIRMNGQAVFKFAVKKVPEVIEEVLDKNQIDKEEIDGFLLHQANGRIIEAVAKRLDQPMHKFPMNLEAYGNTSSASIPLLLDECNRNGRLLEGKKYVLAGFGGGLTWGAAIVEW